MTKGEYLKDIIPYEKWLEGHKKYVKEQLDKMRPWFNTDTFIKDHLDLATKQVLESLLADADCNYNCEFGELENYLARWLCIPYEKVVEYRTQKFWDEINKKHDLKGDTI